MVIFCCAERGRARSEREAGSSERRGERRQ